MTPCSLLDLECMIQNVYFSVQEEQFFDQTMGGPNLGSLGTTIQDSSKRDSFWLYLYFPFQKLHHPFMRHACECDRFCPWALLTYTSLGMIISIILSLWYWKEYNLFIDFIIICIDFAQWGSDVWIIYAGCPCLWSPGQNISCFWSVCFELYCVVLFMFLCFELYWFVYVFMFYWTSELYCSVWLFCKLYCLLI